MTYSNKAIQFDTEELVVGKGICDVIERDDYVIILLSDGSTMDIYYNENTKPHICFRGTYWKPTDSEEN